jgi:MFS superfamily sulfate permease-like transporter
MNVEIHHADPGFRRWAPLVLVAVLVLGGIGVWALDAWLDARARTDGNDAMLLVAVGLVVVLASVSFGLAVALWQEAGLIRREDRFPASDMRTLRDVPVRHGNEARRYASAMRAGAVVAGAAGLGILFWGWRMLEMVA